MMENIGSREMVLIVYAIGFALTTFGYASLSNIPNIPGYALNILSFAVLLSFCGVLIAYFSCIDQKQIQHLEEEVEALKKLRK
jgi:Na+/melibiose symporter-like transporter